MWGLCWPSPQPCPVRATWELGPGSLLAPPRNTQTLLTWNAWANTECSIRGWGLKVSSVLIGWVWFSVSVTLRESDACRVDWGGRWVFPCRARSCLLCKELSLPTGSPQVSRRRGMRRGPLRRTLPSDSDLESSRYLWSLVACGSQLFPVKNQKISNWDNLVISTWSAGRQWVRKRQICPSPYLLCRDQWWTFWAFRSL